jgi:acylphosphatase
MSNVIRKVMIQGRVQGVGYRAWVEWEATARGLEGWVRNRRDGSVEALLAGAAEAVEEMIAACRQGPPMARVNAVKEETVQASELNFRSPGEPFSVLPTI